MTATVRQLWVLLLLGVGIVACGSTVTSTPLTPPPAPVVTQEPPQVAQEPEPDRRYVYAGYPVSTTPESECTVLENIAYVACYSEMRKAPLWVAYPLTAPENIDCLRGALSRGCYLA